MSAALVPVAQKRGWALGLARRYARRALARRFEGVYVDGWREARAHAQGVPLLLCANHSTWWDGFVITLLDEALGTDGFVLMDEANLARLPFFVALGALPLSLTSPRRAHAQLTHAAEMLHAPGRALWIFPQGAQRPAHKRPLGFRSGVAMLARRAACAAVPVAITIVWRDRPEPALLVRFGAPRAPGARTLASALEADVADGLDLLEARALAGELPPALVRGTAKGADAGIGARLLTRMVRP